MAPRQLDHRPIRKHDHNQRSTPTTTGGGLIGIFGHDTEQDERLDAIGHHMRRMTEQIGQRSVDLGMTRMEMLKHASPWAKP
jgi:hypothetical protein